MVSRFVVMAGLRTARATRGTSTARLTSNRTVNVLPHRAFPMRPQVAHMAMVPVVATVGRAILSRVVFGTVLFGAGSFGLKEMEDMFEEMPDLGPVSELAGGVVGLIGNSLKWGAEVFDDLSKSTASSESSDVVGEDPTSDDATGIATDVQDPDDDDAENTSTDEEDAAREEAEKENAMLREMLAELKETQLKHEDEQDGIARRYHEELKKLSKALETEIDSLKTENTALRRRMILESGSTTDMRHKTAAEMYADIIHYRQSADSAFESADHLPRVVVLGDQSAGKTSVLEMIAQARIFPRGDGEMMTKTPIQVTMSNAPERTAKLRDEERLYNLDKPQDLLALQQQIKHKMNESVPADCAVADKTISLDVRGPGLRPMVLVDLPGMIQHHTLGMHSGTKDAIADMCKSHIANPHSIILCIQDATRDAEGSGFADFVREVDPTGARTIFVMTKVDLAEQMKKPAERLERILKGQVFNMSARNYFAVVTGTSNPSDSIAKIRKSEKDFFEHSDLFLTGVIKANTMGTDNLARAVSRSFWELVYESIQVELKKTNADLKKKENEWKSRYPGKHRMNRADLFVIGRHKVLESIATFNSTLTAMDLERLLTNNLFAEVQPYLLDTLYIGAAESADPGTFKTNCENLLDVWASKELAETSVKVAHKTLIGELEKVLNFPDVDGTFTLLKKHAIDTCSGKLTWPQSSVTKVQNVQELKLRDDQIPDKRSWEEACRFMSRVVETEQLKSKTEIDKGVGSGLVWRWITWERVSALQNARKHAIQELTSFFPTSKVAKPWLNAKEAEGICLSVNRATGARINENFIHETYKLLYRSHFLKLSAESANYCKSRYRSNESDNSAPNGLACSDVLLFWRISSMLQSTGNVLRVEALNYKVAMEDELRSTLSDIQDDKVQMTNVLASPQVTLAEEIELIRLTLSKFNTFVAKLDSESKGVFPN
eukprot:m.130923 g.130923  ORF g.130923 m.130923 type:complete len:950 (+) comp29511_c0_seq2:200-3049(+)